MQKELLGFTFLFSALTLQASPTFDFKLTGLDGAAVSGTALFTLLDPHHFSITVTNTTQMQSIEQLVAGIQFSMPGDGITLISSAGGFIVVDQDGHVSHVWPGKTDWEFERTDTGFVLCAKCGGSDAPYIIGSGPYSSDFDGTYLGGSVTFEFSTDASMAMDGTDPFSRVAFLFAKEPDNNWPLSSGLGSPGTLGQTGPGTDNPDSPGNSDPGGSGDSPAAAIIPEPAAWRLSTAALLALGAAKRFRRRKP